MTDRQVEYIRQLQERNRMKKMMNEKTEQQIQQEELERGFSTHFRGAHQAKEPVSVAPNATTKPVVIKNTKSSSPYDIAQRLQGRPDSRNRSGPRSGMNFASEDNNEAESNNSDQITPRNLEYESQTPCADASKAQLAPRSVGDLQSMSKEQKLVLLQLLQDSINSDGNPLPSISALAPTEENGLESFNEEAPALFPTAREVPVVGNSSPVGKLAIKVKVFSSLAGSKHVTLHGMRLRYYFSLTARSRADYLSASSLYKPNDLHGLQFLDLLHHFSCKLSQGVETVRHTPDVAAGIKAMLGTTSVGQFRLALPAYSSLEVAWECDDIEGLIVSMLNQNNQHSVKHVELSNLKLLLWNGDGQDMASGARDVEVIVNGKSLFNSELCEGAAGVCRSTDFANHIFTKETAPNLALDVVPGGADATGSNSQQHIRGTLASLQSAGRITALQPPITAPPIAVAQGPSSHPTPRLDSAQAVTLVEDETGKPDWLSSGRDGVTSKAVSVHDDLFAASTPVRAVSRKSRRAAAEPLPSPGPSLEAAEVERKTDSPKRALKGRRRGNARSSTNLFDGESGDGMTHVSSITSLTNQGLGGGISPFSQDKPGRDGLRRSLEAVTHAEQFNFNRLPAAVALHSSSQEVVRDDRDLDSATDSSKSTAAPPRAEKLDRQRRIADVNSKVSNALSDLADILHGVNLSKQPLSTSIAPVALAPRAHTLAHAPVPASACPRGSCIRIDVFSTWGDSSYVGLNGIEIYDDKLELVPAMALSSNPFVASISAYPASLTALRGYEDDPRNITNLLDGVNETRDDLHHWLAPQLPLLKTVMQTDNSVLAPEPPFVEEIEDREGLLASILIMLSVPVSIGGMLVYNFNKSRTHNQRGVRRCRVLLDSLVVYDGEIKKASGQQKSGHSDAQVLAFTSDRALRDRLAALQGQSSAQDDGDADELEESMVSVQARPRTAMVEDQDAPATVQPPLREETEEEVYAPATMALAASGRPSTPGSVETDPAPSSALSVVKSVDGLDLSGDFMREVMALQLQSPTQPRLAPSVSGPSLSSAIAPVASEAEQRTPGITCSNLRIVLTSTHGDRDYIGLSRVHLLSPSWQVLQCSDVQTDPNKDISQVYAQADNQHRKLALSHTQDHEYMYLAPYCSGPQTSGDAQALSRDHQFVRFVLSRPAEVAGLCVFNYNGAGEGRLRGAREVVIFVDDKVAFRAKLSAAPGHDQVTFQQVLLFHHLHALEASPALFPPFLAMPTVYSPGQSLFAPNPQALAAQKQTYVGGRPLTGLTFTFKLYGTQGDPFYIGLDHIDVYVLTPEGPNGKVRLLTLSSLLEMGAFVTACPHSVNVLSSSPRRDPRVPEQLLVRHHEAPKGQALRSCWLAPLATTLSDEERAMHRERASALLFSRHPKSLVLTRSAPQGASKAAAPRENQLVLSFPVPVTVVGMRLFNYSRTASRGVRTFGLEVDGLTAFMGDLVSADEELPGRGQALIFSSDAGLSALLREGAVCPPVDQDVLCINERQVMVRSRTMYDNDQSQIDILKRPSTSYIG